MESTSLKMYDNPKHQDILSTHLSPNILPILISLTPVSISASIPLITIKYRYERLRKYLIPGNFLTL